MKKYNEIEQRPENRLLFSCHCGSFAHFAMFDYYTFDKTKVFSVSLIDTPDTFWRRLEKAMRYVVWGKDLYHIDVSLNEKDLDQVVKLIKEYKELQYEEEK
jgi:hypothetical protein